MKTESTNRRYYELVSEVMQAMSHPVRILLLDMLCQCERSVDELANVSMEPVRNTSHHLQQLKRASLVTSRRDGRRILYRPADDAVVSIWSAFRSFAEARIPELKLGALEERRIESDSMEPLKDWDDLIDKAKRGEISLVDVRPEEEFDFDHLPGAVSIPLERLERHAKDLTPGVPMVVYCRGGACRLARTAVDRLQKMGFFAVCIEKGVVDWKARGFDFIEQSSIQVG